MMDICNHSVFRNMTLTLSCRKPTAETTAPSENRSYRTATTSTSRTNMECSSVWETTGRGCRAGIEASRLWPSSFPGSAPCSRPRILSCTPRTSRASRKLKNPWTLWTLLENCLRSFTVPASIRDETAAWRLSYRVVNPALFPARCPTEQLRPGTDKTSGLKGCEDIQPVMPGQM